MEQLLRGQEAFAVGELPTDGQRLWEPWENGPVFFFPIRHHSPACGFHLRQVIESYKPDCILIEGPKNAEELIPALVHEDTKAPVALYYYYKDSKGLLNEEKGDYRCYYPFLDYSPELLALREAAKRKIPARFVDLPYGEILIRTEENRGIRGGGEKQTYNDDYLLSRSQYFALLCEKTGVGSFGEFWEKYFETGGFFMDTGAFVRQMRTYCSMTRKYTPREELEKDGCLLREQYMAQQVAETSEKFKRILVVTGGFHTDGIVELLEWTEEAVGEKPEKVELEKKNTAGRIVYKGEAVKLHKLAESDQGVYPLAYSMEAADALNGYASGMEAPGFYQRVWEELERLGHVKGAYEAAVLHQLVSAGRQARKKKEGISSFDVACAYSMAKGLGSLRGKWEPGLYELRDGALSAFVKGECSPSTDLPLQILQELNTGKQVGSLCTNAPKPPILGDFEEKCKQFGLKIYGSVRQEVTLEIFAKKKHLAASRFFCQMEFLETGFGVREKGADLVNRRDKSRIREVWRYRFSSHVLSVLIDVSMSGGTVEEAARTRLGRKFKETTGFREAARLLTVGFLMGFLREQTEMKVHVEQVLAADGDFFSLTEGFSYLRMLYELQELYQTYAFPQLESMIGTCFQKIIQLLPAMALVAEEKEQDCMDSCLSLYQITGREVFSKFRPVLLEAFLRLLGQKKIRPGLEGAVMGLAYGCDSSYEDKIWEAAAGYLQGTGEQQMKSALFLRGLFYTAKDLVFVREGFLQMIDGLLARLSPEEFLELLPEFRRAFGYFTPMETDRIAGKAAALHGEGKKQLLKGRMVSPIEYRYGEDLDQYGKWRMSAEEIDNK